MSAWHFSRLLVGIGLAMTVAGFAMGMTGIWIQSGPLGGMAALSGLPGLVLALTTAMYISDVKPKRPPRRMARSDRRRIAVEQSRIAADAEIARLEREAGIR